MRKPVSDESMETAFLEDLEDESDHRGIKSAAQILGKAQPTSLYDARIISNREELIQRIKRGESPTWLPSRGLEGFSLGPGSKGDSLPRKGLSSNYGRKTPTPPLLPPAEIHTQRPPSRSSPSRDETLRLAAEIQRPRSALHAGDFTSSRQSDTSAEALCEPLSTPRQNLHHVALAAAFQAIEVERNVYGTSPTTPWYSPSPRLGSIPYTSSPSYSEDEYPKLQSHGRTRAPSLSSLSSGFIFRPPTSPLVQTSNSYDTDQPPPDSSVKFNRRHTLPPRAFSSRSPPLQPGGNNHSSRHPISSTRRESAFPYQAHQPRRSLNSISRIQTSPPLTPGAYRARRPSFPSGTSPLHHAPMVGSYEESILRGRMSTAPSKPLLFVAQIGVLGLGNCKPHLRCPDHVSVAFPAVFYSYGKANLGGRSPAIEDGPSPYVGLVDLENSLEAPKQNRRNRPSESHDRGIDMRIASPGAPSRYLDQVRHLGPTRSATVEAPPGGRYRIPRKGQLQIVIKNPNKTAVKLFLVPYDLTGMEAGQRTFIRQRSYSTGPILEIPLHDGTRPPSSVMERPTLRYLIHLHICCPSRGRYFLYKSIRVVFANRVPDGKERLRNEIQLPEPRWMSYRPTASPSVSRNSIQGESSVSGPAWRRDDEFTDAAHDTSPYSRGMDISSELPLRGSEIALGVAPIPSSLADGKPVAFRSTPLTDWHVSNEAKRDSHHVEGN